MNELSDKLSAAYSREELNVLCYELGLDPDELEDGTKSELIWQIITWCQRRGKLANLIHLCREQRPHIRWPDPSTSKMTDIPHTKPSANEYAARRKLLSRQSRKWVLGLGGVIILFLCAWATVTLASNFLADFNLPGQVPISLTDISPSNVEGNTMQGSEPSDTPSGPNDVIGTISISDLRTAGLGLEEIQVLGHGGIVNSVTWSPDSKQLATASRDSRIRIWDVMTGQVLQSLPKDRQSPGSNSINSVAWSPAGNLLLSSDGNALRFWDLETGEEVRALEDLKSEVWVVNWSPDSTRFAWGNALPEASVQVWDLTTMQEQFTLSGHGGMASDFAWSPDGTLIASGGENNMVHIWDAGTGAEIYILPYHTDWVRGLAWSPDSTKLASVSNDNTLRIIEASTGQQIYAIEIDNDIETVDWSSNSELIAIGGTLNINSSGNWEYIWVLDALTGEKLYGLTGHTGSVTDVAWSPDSTMLASASSDNTVRIWRLLDDE